MNRHFQPLGVRKTPISPAKDDHNNGPDQLWAQAIATAWADTVRTKTPLEFEIQAPLAFTSADVLGTVHIIERKDPEMLYLI